MNWDLNQWLRQHTTVHFSPFTEMICSLHVLSRPEHHPFRLAWSQELRSRLPVRFLQDLSNLGTLTSDWLALLDLDMVPSRPLSVEQALERISRLPDAQLLVLMFNQEFALDEVVGFIQKQPASAYREERLTELQQLALQKPALTRRRLRTFLEQYYHTYFSTEWSRIEPWLVRAGHVFVEKVKRAPKKTFGLLHPRLSAHSDAIYAQKTTLYRFPYREIENLVIVASTFIHPHLLVGKLGGTLAVPLAVEVPGIPRQREVPSDLVLMFKALADATRLKIVRSLAEQPHCTQQLAKLHGISEAAVSKHLRALLRARFVHTERRGNYVFYALDETEVEGVLVYLRNFLEQ